MSGGTLLELVTEAAELEHRLVALAEKSGGEIDEELDKFLAQVQEQLLVKVDSYKFAIDRTESSAEVMRKQAVEFTRAARALENFADNLKDRIKQAMLIRKETEVRGQNWRFKLSVLDPKIEIDVGLLPPEYTVEVVTRAANRERIKAAVGEGLSIPGVTLVPSSRLAPYPNKRDKS